MRTLTIYLLVIIPYFGFGQITIEQSDMPSVGDVIPRRSDTLTPLTGPGPSGANQAWEMTETSFYVVQENTNVVSASSTPNGSSFPSANLAMTLDNSNYLYFGSSPTSFTCLGYTGDLLNTGSPITVNFSPDLTLHQFPRTYNSTFDDNFIIDVTIPAASINPILNQIRFKRSSQVNDVTDGWGVIHTPGDKYYNVLRVHTTTISIDSIWALPLFPPTWTLVSTSQDTTESYVWLAKDGKLAVAEMSFDTLGAPKIFKWTELPGIALNTDEFSLESEIKVFPNPFGSAIQVNVPDRFVGKNCQIRDVAGRLISVEYFSESNKMIATDAWHSGVYFLEFEGLTAPRKIVKN